jgi:hypothetical protein
LNYCLFCGASVMGKPAFSQCRQLDRRMHAAASFFGSARPE